MEKRAEFLRIDINKKDDKKYKIYKQYEKEITNEKQFTAHLNICNIMNASHDENFI